MLREPRFAPRSLPHAQPGHSPQLGTVLQEGHLSREGGEEDVLQVLLCGQLDSPVLHPQGQPVEGESHVEEQVVHKAIQQAGRG